MTDDIAYDSAAGDSIFNNLKWFTELHALPFPKYYIGSTGYITRVEYFGSIAFSVTHDDGKEATSETRQALFNPASPTNILCAAKLLDDGIFWNQEDHFLYVKQNGEKVADLQRNGDVFYVANTTPAGFIKEISSAPTALSRGRGLTGFRYGNLRYL
ncbi:hypothetical protein VTK56DRAFT_9783 [Thermocarpiscus australiensis]